MIIDFITSRMSAGAEIAYPLLLFRKEIAASGLDVRIKFNLNYSGRSKRPDLIILTYPFFRDQFPSNSAFSAVSDTVLKKAFESARKQCGNIVFFETTDATASAYLQYLPYVDLMLKWQLFSDKAYYCTDDYANKPLIWITERQRDCPKADPEQIHKLHVGWNLAYRNYSVFRRGGRHLHWRGFTWNPSFSAVDRKRPLLTFFRGELTGHRAAHRQAAIDVMSKMSHPDIVLGKPVSRYRYLQEIQMSKAVVSPFGYGELCYRDMEAFIHGAILIKPSMAHIVTFPDVYKDDLTYVPVDWQFKNLEKALKAIDEQYEQFRHIAQTGQSTYRVCLNDPKSFVDHLRSIVDRATEMGAEIDRRGDALAVGQYELR